jgi:thiopeptide-type bacteriocin biosynthesis protein
LYAKLYAGPAACDDVIRRLAPLARGADQWFFIRYSDPDHHVRVRFRSDSKRLERRLHRATSVLLDEGLVWRVQLDTYEREVERYGGDEGVLLAERLFHIDSDAVVAILEMLEPGDEGLDERWQLALAGVDLLLTDFGLDTLAKRELVRSARGDSATLHRQMAANFRESREALELLLEAGGDHPLAPGLEALRTRSSRIRPIATELQHLDHNRRLAIPLRNLLPSYTHMHVNRLLRSAQLQQERVIYDYLARLYDARLSR